MYVSELVVELNKHLENNGDCEVALYHAAIGYEVDIEDIQVIEEHDTLVLIGTN